MFIKIVEIPTNKRKYILDKKGSDTIWGQIKKQRNSEGRGDYRESSNRKVDYYNEAKSKQLMDAVRANDIDAVKRLMK